jgi:dTDP-4-dehydrorhamnose 3,5-epimerase
MSFRFEPTEIPDVVLVHATRHSDARGFFSETYKASAFHEAGLDVVFVQLNVARSAPRVLRGLHYQLHPKAQGKLVQVLRGSVYDVAVDLRREAPTYGKWVARTLDADQGTLLWIPAGFAHGYAVLSDDGADLAYSVTEEYAPDLDRGIRWDDPEIGVEWPLPDPILSEKDRALPSLHEADHPTPA